MNGPEPVALLLTDLVDSTALAERLGTLAWAELSVAHERVARDLLRDWHGREIDKTDGFLLIFDRAADALGYALAYHQALGRLQVPLRARAGLHVGAVVLRTNPRPDVDQGAKPLEVDGPNKALAARVMALALGGQTLLTGAARQALGDTLQRLISHGHWRLKGLADPVELFEAATADAPGTPPPDSAKAYRVVREVTAWRPLREIAHSLPTPRDEFVGRTQALHELTAAFDRGARLVSVLGIGGSGKTRLAIRFGRTWLGDFPGGVWFCDLAPARSVNGVIRAVAKGLDVALGDEDPVVQLGHAIGARGPCLVILDNFEQVTRHAEATLGRWLDRATEARFLVTTREVLGIAGEQAFALPPLSQPEAAHLFMLRAAAARHDFQPEQSDEAVVLELTRLLDGLPLAIELAAARVRLLSPSALLQRMSERFKLLVASGGRHDRQSTLRTAFDWSWDLLTLAEKSTLAQLSVFEGGFTLEAVEAVVDVSAIEGAPWIVDLLHSLVDKSFVRTRDDQRFELLVSVQAYAAEHLSTEGRYAGSGGAALHAAQLRHGGWFAARGPARAIDGACADLPNLLIACRRAVASGHVESAVGALEGAWAALSLQGPFGGGVLLAEAVGAMPSLGAGWAARADAVCGSAYLAVGRTAAARARFESALTLARDGADRRCEARVTIDLAGLKAQQGRVEEAIADHARALDVAREIGDIETECSALSGLGNAEFDRGRLDEARQRFEACLARARGVRDLRTQCSMLGNLGMLHANLGRMDDALTHCEESLRLARRLGDRQRECNTLCNLGMLNLLRGRLDDSILHSEQALQAARQLGHVRTESMVLCNLGLALEESGRIALALDKFNAALRVARELGDRNAEGQFLGYLGRAHARQRAFAVARECFAAGQALLREVSDPLSIGVLLCGSAECELAAGDAAAALRMLEEVQAIVQATGAGLQSELGLAMARLQRLLEAPPAEGANAGS